jgi:hypothetical protein
MADTQKRRLGGEAEPAGRMMLHTQRLRGRAAIVVMWVIRIAVLMTVPVVVMIMDAMLASMGAGEADAVAVGSEDTGAKPGEHAEQQHPCQKSPHLRAEIRCNPRPAQEVFPEPVHAACESLPWLRSRRLDC